MIKIGSKYIFNYPKEFTSLPEYSLRRGATVLVVRELEDGLEYDREDGERMYEIEIIANGHAWQGHAFESELIKA